MSSSELMRQMRQPVRVTAATLPVMSVGDLKAHLRIDYGDEDSVLTDYIAAASRRLEDDAEIALLTSTWAVYLDQFPCWEIELRKPPVKSLTSITYVDTDGTTQTLSASLYRSDIYHSPARVTPAYGETWPATQSVSNAVTVTFVSGETSSSSIEPTAMQAIRLLAGHWFRNREAFGEKPMHDAGLSYDALVSRLRWAGNV